MSKDIRKVRKAIEQRKKERNVPNKGIEQDSGIFHQAEEKHGYPPEINNYVFKEKASKDFVTGLMMKGILAGILFFSVALLMTTNHALLAKPQEVVHQLLRKDFQFAKVNSWYRDVFGSPLAFSPQPADLPDEHQEVVMPINGDIIETFQTNGTGVKISPGKETDIVAHHEGVVVFAGRYPDTGRTIVIQHADGTNSRYGHLTNIDVHLYQYVTANERIGTFAPTESSESVFFSLEKDNTFLDPVKVIVVDDGP
ncbi:M23 family metallopeptidase [Oceanobacillus alkalisoli]|uniref:M23 family metallopeptidase n=1 Tax=Oceanobacillus alkalisoli TaxID=2925113 RepID=UPI001EEFA96D|nr:M23 family metallopeptidase [Oceanobacillus alkalisoli]MCF3941886.1 M23 family metallopeptidase [Oceanobacillus alkalisoli]MCG5104261.1 M23 family metallopeptidase [Oceanobacillus alkalisoli]